VAEDKTKSFSESLFRGLNKPQGEDVDAMRQMGVGAFTLRVKYGDNRRIEGLAWSHYTSYEWRCLDDGPERLALLFGARVIIVEGYRLDKLLREINDGRRRTIAELSPTEAMLKLADADDTEPVICSVRVEPSFESIVREIRGEERDR
jgi:hypothetical protein